jgi:hypothetical protein
MGHDFAGLIANTPLTDCWEFWRSCRQGRTVPLKRRLDPVAMPPRMLPHLFLYERTAARRFRCRLAGTAVCELFQSNPTGRYLDDMIPPAFLQSRLRLFNAVLERERPVVYEGHIAERGREWVPFLRLLVPVSSDGVAADTVFGMVILRDPGSFATRVAPELGALGAVAFAADADLA